MSGVWRKERFCIFRLV